MSETTGRQARLERALQAAFDPTVLRVEDDSARHAGHAGAAAGGQTHFNIVMVAERFAGMGRVARSRAVHEALAAEFDAGLHALSLKLRSPQEGLS